MRLASEHPTIDSATTPHTVWPKKLAHFVLYTLT